MRTLAPGDAESYRALMLEAYAREPDAFTSTAEERAREPLAWWVRRIAHPDGESVAFGAFDDAALIGTVAVEFPARTRTAHKAHLVGMYVRPAARGHGLARALLDAAITRCEAREATRVVQLTVTAGNQAAIALYQAAGFVAFGTEPLAIRVPDGYRSKLHMWRSVEPREAS